MRTLEELYILLYKEFENKVGYYEFICVSIVDLDLDGQITEEEKVLLLDNFHLNRPSKTLHTEYWSHALYCEHCASWFGSGVASTKLRAEFLNYLIKNHIA